MESHSGLVRLKEFQIEGHRRKSAQIRTMIAEFDRLVAELDREIHAEEVRSGMHDPTYFAYPTYAKAARQRRDNLKRSTADLMLQLGAVQKALGEARDELDVMTASQPMMPVPVEQHDLTRAS